MTSIDADGVTYKSGDESKRLLAKTVLWAGGVTTNEFGRKLGERTHAETDRSGRIKVNRRPDRSGLSGHFHRWRFGALSRAKMGNHSRVLRRWPFRAEPTLQKSFAPGRREEGNKTISLFQQGGHGGYWPSRGGCKYFWLSSRRASLRGSLGSLSI